MTLFDVDPEAGLDAELEPMDDCPPEVLDAMGGVAPTLQQWRAISHPLSPYAIIAGAGSGKTSLMAARIAYLALVHTGKLVVDHEGVPPSEVLGLTFTNKAAEHLTLKTRQAVAGLGLPESEHPTVMTYNSFGDHLLRTYGMHLGLDTESLLLSEAHRWEIAEQVIDEALFEWLEVRSPGYVTRLILGLSDQCANYGVDPQEVIRADEAFLDRIEDERLYRWQIAAARKRIEIARAVAAYRVRKTALNRIDYADQIELAVRIARERPEVGEELRSRYRLALLDEYQDTDLAQADMIRHLFPAPFPVTAVGDPDQNIFAWRGANLTNLLDFPEIFAVESGTPALPLYKNFRSGWAILNVANAVIQEVPEVRRAPDKQLHPWAERGRGTVQAFAARDQVEEADTIARLILEEHANGRPWGEIAVLCRKKRLFRMLGDRLRANGVPVEMVDLAGLMQVPEIVDLVAHLRLIADPSRNISFARIAMGPRWRVGYRDLARLARWSAVNNSEFRKGIHEEDDVSPGDTVFALAEALDHLDQITDLSVDGRVRLQALRDEIGALRAHADTTPADLAFRITEEIGLLSEIDASPSPIARAVRRNVLSFLDHLAAFAPLAGEATLGVLLDYLDRVELAEDDLEASQPSEDDTVKLMTIHKAKGLEWDVVFVPGLAEGDRSSIFPDTRGEENPLTRPGVVPYQLRPGFEGFPDPFDDYDGWKEELKARALEAERRDCYVALTRARQRLVVSSAHWYEGTSGLLKDPLRPGTFYQEIVACPETEVLFEHTLQAGEGEGEDAGAAVDPLRQARALRAAEWPPEARPDVPDPVFAGGWRRAAEEAVADPSLADRLAADLSPHERTAFEGAKDAALDRLAFLAEHDPAKEPRPLPVPSGLSVSSLVTYDRCPKQFYWSVVRPLPRKPNPAATLGTAIHRWIEQESRGQGRLLDLDALPDQTPGTGGDEVAADETTLKETWRRSRFSSMVPLYTERPFELLVDGAVVRGRIDAVYGDAGGAWEIVDFKTGRRPADAERSDVQLQLYALACQEIWGKDPAELTLTYYFLGSDDEAAVPVPTAEEARAAVSAHLAGIRGRAFAPTPGPPCHSCDFRPFCPPGREWVQTQG